MKTFNTTYHSTESLSIFIEKNHIDTHQNILLQIFTAHCDVAYIENLIESIKKMIPHIKIIGATTSGEIIDGIAHLNTTLLSFSLFEKTQIETHYHESKEKSSLVARELLNTFDTSRTPKVGISFLDGIHSDAESYLQTFQILKPELVIAGGLAGDNTNFVETIVFTENRVFTQGAVIALLYNDTLQVTTHANLGWNSIGKTMTITKAEGNVVYEIDGERCCQVYKKYLGEDIAKGLPNTSIEFPLIIQKENEEIARTAVAKKENGALKFSGDFITGDKVTFGYGNIQTILHDSQTLYHNPQIRQSESLFIYSCVARFKLLGQAINDELTPLQNISSVSGFFTYGEFYTNKKSTEARLLNEAMTILGLSEEENPSTKSIVSYDFLNNSNKENPTLKVLAHFVSQTTKELEEANQILHNRVEHEVEKNKKIVKTMLQQTKLAQMGEMINMIAHQWRQPLSSINALSQTLNLKESLGILDSKTTLELSKKISSNIHYLSETIDDFRDFFKPKKEKNLTNYEEIVQSVLNIIGPSISTKNIEIIQDMHCEVTFNSYSNELKQVVLNLIKNAEDALMEHHTKAPYIKISSYQHNNRYILTIQDNAGGIPHNIKEKIFDPYFSTKKEKNGTGLGLYMSKTIIEEHCGGELKLINYDSGAMFKIELPHT